MKYTCCRQNTARGDQLWKTEVRVHASPATVVEQHLHIQRRSSLPETQECYKCGKKGHFQGSCSSKKEEKEVGRAKDTKRKQKLAKVHEQKAQLTAGTWTQQPCTAQQRPTSMKRTTGSDVPPHEMGQVNSLDRQEDNSTSDHCGWQHIPWYRSKNSTAKLTLEQGATSCPCTSTDKFLGTGTKLPTMIITENGNSSVANTGSYTAVLLTVCQAQGKPCSKSLTLRGYLILGRETASKIGYIHFPKITLPKLTQQPKTHTHTHLKAIKTKTSRQEAANEKDWGLKCLRVQLLDCTLLINRKKYRLPITKE